MAAEMNLEPGKGTSSYKVTLSAKSKTKPAPLDMSRTNTSPMEKDKTVTTPKGKIGHRRVDETGETLYKKTTSSALMSAIQLGIGFSVGRLSAKPERDVLMQDFALVETVDFPSGGTRETPAHGFSDFSFKTYAPVAFRYFRELFTMKPDDFLVALCNEPLQELSNPGASGSLFYVTNDDEFIIKTVQHKEAEFLQKLLPGYYLNLNQNKRTLLPKFFGLHCYQCSGKNIRLAIMNNLISREFKIHMKYDLKGSTYKRKASKAERAKASPTLKDLDFVNDHPQGLFLEADTYNAVIKIIQRDCRVLESFKIMDYSLLLGIHNLDEAAKEAGQKTFTPSGRLPSSCEYPHTPKSPDDGSGNTRPSLGRSRSVKGREGFSSEWEAITLKDTEERPVGGIPARNNKEERLLLFIGIIDILQSYRLKKKLEHGWKALVYDGDTVSVHRPGFYSKRFQEFFANNVFKKIPGRDKISPRRRSVNRARSMTETERSRPELRREHSFESAASERRLRTLTDNTEDPTRTRKSSLNAKENLEGKFESESTSAGQTSKAMRANENEKTVDKKVVFLDLQGGNSHDVDHEHIDISITENHTTTTKSQTAKFKGSVDRQVSFQLPGPVATSD